MTENNTFYVTTPIYYLSGTPHIGTAYTSIAADVLARFHTLDGKDVKFLTGTDEHGLKVLRCAEEEGLTAQAYCDREAKKFMALKDMFNLSYDDFLRTTEERHIKASQAMWTRLSDAGYIYKDSYSGWYAVSDEAYYDEDEIETRDDGTKVSKESGSTVEWMEEESYFFKLTAFKDKLLEYYDSGAILPKSRANEVRGFVKQLDRDLSISRTTFDWGVPVPGDEKHVMYVWIDALTNYLTALGFEGEETPDMAKYWPNVTHLVGKDILRFHAVYWPAFLMAADLPTPNRVFAHGWLLADGAKMSKSKGNVISPQELIDRYGVDQTRYFLMREVPFGNDGSISHDALVTRVNADLANNFGNLAQRTLSMIYKNCDAVIPEANLNEPIIALSHTQLAEAKKAIETVQLHSYLESAITLSREANNYIDEKAPWTLKKEDPDAMKQVLGTLAETIARIAIMLLPIMPESAAKVLDQLNVSGKKRNFSAINLDDTVLEPGQEIQKPEGVFPRLDLEEAA